MPPRGLKMRNRGVFVCIYSFTKRKLQKAEMAI